MATEDPGAATAVAPEETPTEVTPEPVVETPEVTPTETPEVTKTEPTEEPQRVAPKPGVRPRQQAREALKATVKRFEESRPRDEHGRFTKEETEPTKEQPASTETPATEEGAEEAPDATPTEATTEVAEGHVRIELEEGHPLREQGTTHLDVLAANERDVRSLINNPTRRSEVESAKAAAEKAATEVATLRRQLARRDAEVGLVQSGELDKLTDPKLQEMLEDADRHNPELAKVLREGIDAKRRELIRTTGDQAEQAARDDEEGEAFLTALQTEGPTLYKVWTDRGTFRERVSQVIGKYGDAVDARLAAGGPGPNIREFYRDFLDPYYVRDPDVQTMLKEHRETEEQRIRNEAGQEARAARDAELETERLEAAQRHGRRPPTTTGRVQVEGRTTGDETEPVPKPGQRFKTARALATKIGREFQR